MADWNNSWEQSPADADSVSKGAEEIRETRSTVGDALGTDHFVKTDAGQTESKIGQHKQVTLYKRTAPSAVADTGYLWTKMGTAGSWPDDSPTNSAELWFTNALGSVRITRSVAGSPNVVTLDAIPKDTVMLFYQAAIPAGWTQVTSGTADSLFAPTYTAPGGAAPTVGGSVVSGNVADKNYNWSFQGIGTTTDSGFGRTETYVLDKKDIPGHTHHVSKSGSTGTNSVSATQSVSAQGSYGSELSYTLGSEGTDRPDVGISSLGDIGNDDVGGAARAHGHNVKQNADDPWRPVISVCLVCKKN